MQFQSATYFGTVQPAWSRRAAIKLSLLTIAALTCAAAAADPVPQLGATAVNANGNSLYNVTLTPNAVPDTGALISQGGPFFASTEPGKMRKRRARAAVSTWACPRWARPRPPPP